MRNEFYRIAKILETDQGDFKAVLAHVVEELGEVTKANRDLKEGKGTFEDLETEAVDLIVTAISLYCKIIGPDNVDYSRFQDIFDKKCSKWEANVELKKRLPTALVDKLSENAQQKLSTQSSFALTTEDIKEVARTIPYCRDEDRDLVYSDGDILK